MSALLETVVGFAGYGGHLVTGKAEEYPIGRAVSVVFLFVDIADVVLDILFCISLAREEGELGWSLTLGILTLVGFVFARFPGSGERVVLLASLLLSVGDADVKIWDKVVVAELLVLALEDATLVTIMAFVEGAYDPADLLSVTTLIVSLVSGLGLLTITLLFRGTYVFSAADRPLFAASNQATRGAGVMTALSALINLVLFILDCISLLPILAGLCLLLVQAALMIPITFLMWLGIVIVIKGGSASLGQPIKVTSGVFYAVTSFTALLLVFVALRWQFRKSTTTKEDDGDEEKEPQNPSESPVFVAKENGDDEAVPTFANASISGRSNGPLQHDDDFTWTGLVGFCSTTGIRKDNTDRAAATAAAAATH